MYMQKWLIYAFGPVIGFIAKQYRILPPHQIRLCLLLNVGGTGWHETNILQNLKGKCWGTWHIVSPLSKKWEGRVPHLSVPMNTRNCSPSDRVAYWCTTSLTTAELRHMQYNIVCDVQTEQFSNVITMNDLIKNYSDQLHL